MIIGSVSLPYSTFLEILLMTTVDGQNKKIKSEQKNTFPYVILLYSIIIDQIYEFE